MCEREPRKQGKSGLVDGLGIAYSAFKSHLARKQGEIRQLQRAGICTASADALLDRMLHRIDALCVERDRLKLENPGATKGMVLGGRRS